MKIPGSVSWGVQHALDSRQGRKQERAEQAGAGKTGAGPYEIWRAGSTEAGIQKQTYRECLEKREGLQANRPVRSGDLVMVITMMPAAAMYGAITTSYQPLGRALQTHYQT